MTDINKKVMTLSIVLGDTCNADCKFCISKLTFKCSPKKCDQWWEKLDKACRVASIGGADTVIITSKREPTSADPEELMSVIKICDKYFPIIELQTNGIRLTDKAFVDELACSGLTTLSISGVSHLQHINQEMMAEAYPNLYEVVPYCNEKGLMTRFCVIMTNETCYNATSLIDILSGAKTIGFHQVTLRIMGTPDVSLIQETAKADKVLKWVTEHQLSTDHLHKIKLFLSQYPLLREFPWGSRVHSVEGTSVCLADCLSEEVGNDYRYIIYFPDGHLRYRWEVPEALIF